MSKFVLLKITAKAPIKTDLSYISGSTMRGVYINKYINKYIDRNINISRDSRYKDKLLSNKIRFFDAYPLVDGKYSIPTPLCFYASKDSIKEFSRDKKPINVKNEFEENILEGEQRVNKSEFSIIENKDLNLIYIDRVENLHNCKKENEKNLFRYEAIDKNQEFYSVIQCEDDMAKEVKACIDKEVVYLGGSKTGGYGRCEIEVQGILSYKDLKDKYKIKLNKNERKIEDKKLLNVFFQSDAIIKDGFGNLVSKIPNEVLEEKLGINKVEIVDASIISKDVKGYNTMWKSKIPSLTAIKAGSVITYSYKGSLNPEKIEALEIEGIGYRKNEGFGRIFINPEFNIKRCCIYDKKESQIVKIPADKLSKESRAIMQNMINNIAKDREADNLANQVVEALEGRNPNQSKKLNLKDFPNAQIGKLINIIIEALDENDEVKSKKIISDFIEGLSKKTKKLYDSKSKCNIFGMSMYSYLKAIIENKAVEEGAIDLSCKYPEFDNIKYHNESLYRMRLKLTKIIMEYKLRETKKRGA